MTEITDTKRWLEIGGLCVITFPIELEYEVQYQILKALKDEDIALMHSKRYHGTPSEKMRLIDITGHSLTASAALRHRLGPDALIENPADIRDVLSQMRKIREQIAKSWWIWSSPSDLLAHEIEEKEIIKAMRVIAKDFSKSHIIIMMPREVHTEEMLTLVKYIADVMIDVEFKNDTIVWKVKKHPEKYGVIGN